MTVAIDFDGVLHKYSMGWADGTCYDPPLDGAIEFLKDQMLTNSVFIFSTRMPEHIIEWFTKYAPEIPTESITVGTQFYNKMGVIGVTRQKIVAHVYVDDRGITFVGNFDKLKNQIENFKTWQQLTKQTM